MQFPDWLPVYGDTLYRGKCAIEQKEQDTFFNQLRIHYPDLASVALHPKNEGARSGAAFNRLARDKRSGFVTGASDIIIPGCVAFVCEQKRRDHTKSSWQPGQLEYLEAAQKLGAFVCVALGYEAAIEAVNDWLEVNRKIQLAAEDSVA